MARELEIVVDVNTQKAEQDLGRVESALGKVEDAAKGADKAIDGNTDALKRNTGAAKQAAEQGRELTDIIRRYAGPALIVEATRRTLDFADSIKELSDKTGFSIEGIQKIGQVAKTSGSSFEQVASSINQLQKRLVEGNKGATEAVKSLGLSVSDLMRMNPDDQFVAIAKAVGSIEDPAKRAQVAMALFGRTGADLIPTLMEIEQGALDSASALSGEFVRAASEAQGHIDDLINKGTKLGQVFLAWPLVWTQRMKELGETLRGVAGELPRLPAGPGAPPVNGALPVPGLPANIGSIERELTAAVRENTQATNRNSVALGAPAGPLPSTSWMSGATFNGSGFGMFRPPVGMNAPGNLLDATFNTNWVPFASPVQSNMPGAAGGGNWFSRLFGGRTGQIAGGVLGMLPGLIPGLSGRGASVGGSAGSLIGSLVGGPLAPVLGPIGGFLGGALGKLFGKSEHSKVNDQRDAFVSAAGGIDALNRKAQEAGMTLDKLLAAKKVKDFERAVRDLEGAFGDLEADQERLRAAAAKYGFELKDMGQAFKQGEVTKGFKELGEDFRVLIQSGIDFNKVAEKMAPEFGALIHTAIETGTTVPRELEPILRKMIEMGTLVDRNGDKFTELGQIPFAESMTEGFDKIVAAIKEVAGLLASALPEAARRGVEGANDAFRDFRIPEVDIRVPGEGDFGNAVPISRGGLVLGPGRVQYFNQGGRVLDMFRPLGTDTVPAMLTPGELVLSKGMVDELSSAIRQPRMPEVRESGSAAPALREVPRLSPGDARVPRDEFRRGGGDIVLLPIMDGAPDVDRIADQIERRLARSIPGNRNRLRDMFDQLYQRRRIRRVA